MNNFKQKKSDLNVENKSKSPEVETIKMGHDFSRFPWTGKQTKKKGSIIVSPKGITKICSSPIALQKIDPQTYTDTQSKGLASRIVKYHEISQNSSKSTQRNVYRKPGQFPVVHLRKNEIVYSPKRNSSSLSVVKIAPPDKSISQSNSRLNILRRGLSAPLPSLGAGLDRIYDNEPLTPTTDIDSIPTRSVLDALKEISRKRINSDGLDAEQVKKQCKEFSEVDSGRFDFAMSGNSKRQREQQSPPSTPVNVGNNSPEQQLQLKKKLCTKSNEILSSLSSSITMRTPKRKIAHIQQRNVIIDQNQVKKSNLQITPPQLKSTRSEPIDNLPKISPVASIEPRLRPDLPSSLNNSKTNSLPVIQVPTSPKIQPIKSKEQKLTLFNQNYDLNKSNMLERKSLAKEENEDNGISFIKPKKSSPTGNVNKDFEKSKLSLMLRFLSGNLDEDEEEDVVDSKSHQIVSNSDEQSTTILSIVAPSSIANSVIPDNTLTSATSQLSSSSNSVLVEPPVTNAINVNVTTSSQITPATTKPPVFTGFTFGKSSTSIAPESTTAINESTSNLISTSITNPTLPSFQFNTPVTSTPIVSSTASFNVNGSALTTASISLPTSTTLPINNEPSKSGFSFGITSPKNAAINLEVSPSSAALFKFDPPKSLVSTNSLATPSTTITTAASSTLHSNLVLNKTSESITVVPTASFTFGSKTTPAGITFGSPTSSTVSTSISSPFSNTSLTAGSTASTTTPTFSFFGNKPIVLSPSNQPAVPSFGSVSNNVINPTSSAPSLVFPSTVQPAVTTAVATTTSTFSFGGAQNKEEKKSVPFSFGGGAGQNAFSSATVTPTTTLSSFTSPQLSTAGSFAFSGQPSNVVNNSFSFGASTTNDNKTIPVVNSSFSFGGGAKTTTAGSNMFSSIANKAITTTTAAAAPLTSGNSTFAFRGGNSEGGFTAVATTTTATFGGLPSATSMNTFGTSVQPSTIFGSNVPSTGATFGGGITTVTPSFGHPAAPSGVSSVFGESQVKPTQSMFNFSGGQNTNTNMPSSSVFGGNVSTSSNVFGSAGGFGSSTKPTTTMAESGKQPFTFGGPSSVAPVSNTQQSPFQFGGNPSTNTTPSSFSFSGGNVNNNAPVFGGSASFSFGQTDATNKAALPSFGSVATTNANLFPNVASATNTTSPFGGNISSASSPAFNFGGNTSMNNVSDPNANSQFNFGGPQNNQNPSPGSNMFSIGSGGGNTMGAQRRPFRNASRRLK